MSCAQGDNAPWQNGENGVDKAPCRGVRALPANVATGRSGMWHRPTWHALSPVSDI